MPFSNKRNSRDDNSNRRRKSTSDYSKAKGRKFRSPDTPGNEKRGSKTGLGKPGKGGMDGDGREGKSARKGKSVEVRNKTGRRRHTNCALVTRIQTFALPI